MDSAIRIPFLNITIKIEPLIGLIPIIGDSIGFVMSSYIMVVLWRNNGSGKLLAKMTVNMMIDAILSFIPILGNVLDFFVKTNEKNLKLAMEYYQEDKHQGSAWAVIIPLTLFLSLLLVLMLVGMYFSLKFVISLLF